MQYIQIIESTLKNRGITAKKMLLDLGYSDNLMSKWKKGSEPSAIKLRRICDYLGLSMDYLLKDEKVNTDIEEDLSLDYIVIKGLHDYFSGLSISDDLFILLSDRTGIDKDRLKSFYVDTKIYVEFDNLKVYHPAVLQRELLKNEFGTICTPEYDEFAKMMDEKNYAIAPAMEKKSCIALLNKLKEINEQKRKNESDTIQISKKELQNMLDEAVSKAIKESKLDTELINENHSDAPSFLDPDEKD